MLKVSHSLKIASFQVKIKILNLQGKNKKCIKIYSHFGPLNKPHVVTESTFMEY